MPFAFAPEGLSWLVHLSFAVLLVCLRDLKPAAAMLAGFWWGFVTFGIAVSWFWNIFGAMALGLFGILACFPAAFAWLNAHVIQRGWKGLGLALFIGVNWTTLEFIRGEIFWLKFPWFGLGLAFTPSALQAWIGTYGVTSLVVTGIAGMITTRRWFTLIPALLPLVPSPPIPEDGAERIVCVQAEGASLEQLLALSRSAHAGPAHFVWPEYSIPTDLRKVAPRDLAALQDFLRERNSILTLGTQTYLEGAAWQNTALTLTGSDILGEHQKNHTVHLFDDGKAGTTALPVRIGVHRVGTPVCFDCDFQDVVRRMTAAGAEYIVAPTMDAISWTERQHLQHGQLFQARAAENGRWIAVAASSGLTQVIDSNGHVRNRLPLVTPAILDATVLPQSQLTFYTRIGWLLPWIIVGTWPLILFGFLTRHARSNRETTSPHQSSRPL